jgi:hypothetical protein
MDDSICLNEILLHWTGSSHLFVDNSVMHRSKIDGGEYCGHPSNSHSSSTSIGSFAKTALISPTLRDARIDDLLLEESSLSTANDTPDPLACRKRAGCHSRWEADRIAPKSHLPTVTDALTSPYTPSSEPDSIGCCSTYSNEASQWEDGSQKALKSINVLSLQIFELRDSPPRMPLRQEPQMCDAPPRMPQRRRYSNPIAFHIE